MIKLLRFAFCLLLFGLLPGSALLSTAAAQPTEKVGSKPQLEEKNLLVYPNPSTGIVHVSVLGFEGRKLELRVLNIIGTVVYRETVTELSDRFTRTLDLSKFASGLYYVKLDTDNTSTMRKLVIR
ncbi:T9SS type A sorting domain-containing protein [Hymenobacter lutimineralis]|uniref:T9SS type A sorting domain-containing protein n=1 Tax=Hymenobacter lutimineralis TaxID=2606448 RepID=A0A5D6VDV7_9BACT|nr:MULTISPECIES: T9SS type A sorting domain-containing protein [Hymenobacter]QIX61807.1 T9SS type A sorting domain-containing protein [Hymenobacter sp. BT18]TYZ12744.1 T9SS type A sorting domain-containing protein [Hymenobacter lutimineralis]